MPYSQKINFSSVIFFLICIHFSFAQKKIIHCKHWIDVETLEIKGESSIFINGNRIEAIVPGINIPRSMEYEIIDLREHTLMPGWIDMHVHLESETSPSKYIERYQDNESDIAYKSVKFAEITLKTGFTSVRDLGGTGVNISLKKAIERGDVLGPRVFTAGKSIASTGGHADPTNGSSKSLMGDPGPNEGVVNSIEDAKKAVRQRYKNGADLIKITATGGVLSQAKSGDNPQFTIEEIKAICQTAKDYGFHVAAHAHGDEGMQRAILGGVTTIEHGTKMSEKTMDMMKKEGVYLVPTIAAGKFVSEKGAIEGYYPAIVRPKALEIGPKIQGTFSKAYKKGVKIAFGTDAGVFPHGENAKEFIYMEEAGMPLLEVLQSATLTPAKILGKETELGQIKEGFLADLVALKGEVNKKNIEAFLSPAFVMKDGKVILFKNE